MTLALYRKYRPQSFAEVIGQEHVTEPLISAISNGRLNHAYLFSGPRGCGKTSSARILARSLNCAKGPTPTPCGECESCIGLSAGGGGSIDVIEIDAASHGGVDDARELRERAVFAPVSSRYKIYVIDEAHMVSSAGFNALLKLVEEPPDYVMFVFATTEPEKVLPTIRSRTHHYPFRLIPPVAMRGLCEKLCEEEGITVADAVYPLVIRAGAGSARDTLSVLDQLIAGAGDEGVTYARAVSLLGVTDGSLLDGICESLSAMDGAGAIGVIDRALEAGHDPRRFTSDLLERLRDLIVLNQVPDAGSTGLIDVPSEVLERMTGQAIRMGTPTLTRVAEIFHNALTAMRGTTAPRLLLELACAKAVLPSVDDSAAGLLQRIDQLERRFADGVPMAAPAARPASPAVHEEQAPAAGLSGREAAKAAAAAASNAPAAPRPASASPAGAGDTATGSHVAATAPGSPADGPVAGHAANAAATGPGGGPAAESHGPGSAGHTASPAGHDGGAAAGPGGSGTAPGSSADGPVAGQAASAAAVAGQPAHSTGPDGSAASGPHGQDANPAAQDGDTAAGSSGHGDGATAEPHDATESGQAATSPNAASAAVDQAASSTPTDHTHPSATVEVSAASHSGSQSDAADPVAGATPAAQAQPSAEGDADGSAPSAAAASAPDGSAGTDGDSSARARTRDSRPSAAAAAASWGDSPAAAPAQAGAAANGQSATTPPSQAAPAGGPGAAAPPSQTGAAASGPAAPASGGDKLTRVRASWDQVKQAVKDRKKTVAAFLMEATVTDVEGDTLVLTFRHTFHANALTSDTAMPIFTSALSSVLGGSWRVRCEIGAAGAPPPRPSGPPPARPAPAAAQPPSARSADSGPGPSIEEEPLPPEPEPEYYDAPPAASSNGSVTMEQAVEMFAKKVGAKKI